MSGHGDPWLRDNLTYFYFVIVELFLTPLADTPHTQQKQDTRKVTCNASPCPEPCRSGGSAAVNNTTTILYRFSKNNIFIKTMAWPRIFIPKWQQRDRN